MMKKLQKLGKALMLPVAVLPICGILMGLGYAIAPGVMGVPDAATSGFAYTLGLFLVKAGGAVIDNMAILFAIGVGVGLSKDNDGTGGVAALVSWLMMTTLVGAAGAIAPSLVENPTWAVAYSKIANPFIGILAGVIGASCYNKFKGTKLPDVLSFFSGKRSVAIVTGVVSILVSAVLLFAWPVIFSVLAAIGHGGLKEGQVINKMIEEREKKNKKDVTDTSILKELTEMTNNGQEPARKSKSGIVVKGIHDLAVRFSKCCSPVPGDEIVGFVTRGRGISIHRTDCINMIYLPEDEKGRLIDAEWQKPEADSGSTTYSTEIKVYANNRIGLFVDISKVFTEKQIDITSMNVRTSKQGKATISMSFDIHGVEELNRLIDKIRQIESVLDIERSAG